jgi:hypothetical protein
MRRRTRVKRAVTSAASDCRHEIVERIGIGCPDEHFALGWGECYLKRVDFASKSNRIAIRNVCAVAGQGCGCFSANTCGISKLIRDSRRFFA